MSALQESASEHAAKLTQILFGNEQEAVLDRETVRAALNETFYTALLLAATSQTRNWASVLGRQEAKTQELINAIFLPKE